MCVFQKRYEYKIKDLNIFLEVEGFWLDREGNCDKKEHTLFHQGLIWFAASYRPRQGEEQLLAKNSRWRKLINSVTAPFSTTMTVLGKETCSRDSEFPLLCADFCACLSPCTILHKDRLRTCC